jgi:hypothetical protein
MDRSNSSMPITTGFLSEKEFNGDEDFKKLDAYKGGKIDSYEGADFLVTVIAPTKFKSYHTNRDGYLDIK